jgi:hypothetical protein
MSASSSDSHILLILSSFLIFVIHIPPFGDPYNTTIKFCYECFTSHMGISPSLKKNRSISLGISDGFFMYTKY